VIAAGRVSAQHSVANTDSENCTDVGHPPRRLGLNGSRHSDGQLESECEHGHERANDVTELCNVPNIGTGVDNHGYAGQGSSQCRANTV
jgi:hypothetical protein